MTKICFVLISLLIIIGSCKNEKKSADTEANKKLSNIIIYSAPEDEELNTMFKVTADGISVPVYNIKVAGKDRNLAMDDKRNSAQYFETTGMTYFDIRKGPVMVTVSVDKVISSAKILPSSYGIVPQINGNSLSFDVDAPKNLTVEINGNEIHSLHIFVNEEETDLPDPKDPDVVYFGPGSYRFPVGELEDGMTVYVAGGAIVHCYVGPHEWFTINKYSGLRNYNKFFMYDLTAKNVTFRGRGIIDQDGIPTHARRSVRINGENINLEGVIFRNPSEWVIDVLDSKNVHINNIKVLGYRADTDGINISSSQNVLVENCFIRTLGNAVSVNDLGGYKPTENIEVKNCIIWNELSHALSVGSRITTEISDVMFSGCEIIRDKGRKSLLSVFQGDAGLAKNIRFENIQIEEANNLASLIIAKDTRTSDEKRGQVQDVFFRNITLVDKPVSTGMVFKGYDQTHVVRNVTVDNVIIDGKKITATEIITNDYVSDVSIK
jgi:hypothetical protein